MGPPMKVAQRAKYLGVLVTPNLSTDVEVGARLSKAGTTYGKLRSFLNQTSLSDRWRFRVYQAVFQSMILYCLESVWLQPRHNARLDAFHFKALRAILGYKSAYYDHFATGHGVPHQK